MVVFILGSLPILWYVRFGFKETSAGLKNPNMLKTFQTITITTLPTNGLAPFRRKWKVWFRFDFPGSFFNPIGCHIEDVKPKDFAEKTDRLTHSI